MFDDPIGERPLETNVSPGLFGLDPFVFEDLFTFGLEFAVQRGVLKQVVGREVLFRFVRHNRAL